MDSKEDSKQPLVGDLPAPGAAQPKSRQPGLTRKLLVLVSSLLVIGYLFGNPLKQLGDDPHHASIDNGSYEGHHYGLTSMRDPVIYKSHKDKDKHGGKKHHKGHKGHGGGGHKGKHGKHGRSCENYNDIFPNTKIEEVYLSVPNNNSARDALRRYTRNSHISGNGHDKLDALNLKHEWERLLGLPVSGPEEKLYDAGSVQSQHHVRGGISKLDVWVDTYYPLMNYPVTSSLTLHSDPPFNAKLQEDIVDGDPDSVLRDEVRPFHGYSVSGDVKGKIVYVGYGRKTDFDMLASKGIDMDGKIALVKYGIVYRGLKVKAAQEAGAIGCIIFTDPGDDGEITAENGYEVYPDGPARQPSSVQRGSVQFLSVYPGDPSTPGEPAYPNATRVESGNQPSIPSLPISFEDAIPLLKDIQGNGIMAKDLQDDWIGGLGHYGVEYWTGPSEADIHLVNEVNTRTTPIWNTMATIPGLIPDEVVIFGNHRDAWVLGASDPNSGTASQHEIIRGLGELLRQGWKPLRTIILASWDGEEYGLVGSTEWAEDFGDWLKENAAVYLNMDSSVSGGILSGSASPSLAWLLRNTASEIMSNKDASRSLWDSRADVSSWAEPRAQAYSGDTVNIEEDASSTGILPMGSGSDFTAFLQRYGIACGEMSFGGGPKSPVYHYHSIYDSFTWMDKFGDPGFHHHTDEARLKGVILLRLADSYVLPLNTTQYAVDMRSYLEKIQHIARVTNGSESLQLDSLSEAIDSVTAASKLLDDEKEGLLKQLHDLLPQLESRGARVCLPSSDDHNGGHHRKQKHGKHGHGKENSWTKWVHYKLERLLRGSHHRPCHAVPGAESADSGAPSAPHLPTDLPVVDKKTLAKVEKVMQDVRIVNKKLQYFEGGFISEGGIKAREWYKHKGVAPGLWLGYGATTFPALTEALTIDHSVELAQKEADELAGMINEMAKKLRA